MHIKKLLSIRVQVTVEVMIEFSDDPDDVSYEQGDITDVISGACTPSIQDVIAALDSDDLLYELDRDADQGDDGLR